MDELMEKVSEHLKTGDLSGAILELASVWNKENPTEELVLTVLPKNNVAERKRTMAFVFEMLDREARCGSSCQ